MARSPRSANADCLMLSSGCYTSNIFPGQSIIPTGAWSVTYHDASCHQLQNRFVAGLHKIHDVDAKTLAQARQQVKSDNYE